MKKFQSLDSLTISGRGLVHVVEIDQDYDSLLVFSGEKVLIDDRLMEVRGVEYFAHASPWRKGERVGLLCKEIKP